MKLFKRLKARFFPKKKKWTLLDPDKKYTGGANSKYSASNAYTPDSVRVEGLAERERKRREI